MTRTKLAALVLGLGAAGSVGVALGLAAGNDTGTITACVDREGSPRIVAAGTTCKGKETTLTWAVQGPQGPQGPPGQPGPPGPVAPPFINFNTVGMVTITGENDTLYKGGDQHGAFEIKDFSFGVENPSTIGSATGGAGAGKVKFNEFTITKHVDAATPQLMQACATNAVIPRVRLSYHPPTSPEETFTVTLTNARCASIHEEPHDSGYELERISLVFATILMTDIPSGVSYEDTWPTESTTTTG